MTEQLASDQGPAPLRVALRVLPRRDTGTVLGFRAPPAWERHLLRAVAPSPWLRARRRAYVLRLAGVKLGDATEIRNGCHFANSRISFGSRCFVNFACAFHPGSATITIGDDVALGVGVVLTAITHDIGPAGQRTGSLRSRPIVIGDGCWLGARVMVLPGVSIAPGCVIGAGSVVTKSTEPNTLYVGTPARPIRKLD